MESLSKDDYFGFTDTRILGYAEAVYDYAATATSQLSLCRGDKVAILSKTGSDKGWWKGEHCISGKVCQVFMSSEEKNLMKTIKNQTLVFFLALHTSINGVVFSEWLFPISLCKRTG